MKTRMAARNVRAGDIVFFFGYASGKITRVERVDWEDRITVRFHYTDYSTWKPCEKTIDFRLDHRITVIKSGASRPAMDWMPVYLPNGRLAPLTKY